MIISFAVAVYFTAYHEAFGFAPLSASMQLILGVAITTAGWLTVTFLTPPAARETLQAFYDRIRPMPRGWRAAVDTSAHTGESPTAAILGWFFGCVVIYGALFGTGFLLYGRPVLGFPIIIGAGAAMVALLRIWPKIGFGD